MIWKNKQNEFIEAYQIVGFGYLNTTVYVLLNGRSNPMPISEAVVDELGIDVNDFLAFPKDPALMETFDLNFSAWDEESFKQEHELVGMNYSGAVH